MSSTPTANIIPSRLPEHDSDLPQAQPTPNQDVSTTRETKRQRPSRHANMAAGRASPTSDSSSQSGMADIETEPEQSHLSERSAQQATDTAPPKKKRTRTLTTPHQSAVLHALLAKSRFPTTAMREEVGRQIGLSPRKVQIWFQNQRQKARRPQSDSAPLSRPPQFGPFPIMTTAGPSSSSYPFPSSGAPPSDASPTVPSSARSAGSLDSISPLSGPGMPGWASSSHQRRHSSVEDRDPPEQRPTSPQTPLGNSNSTRDSRGSTTRGPAPLPAVQATHVETSPHFSRVLPPITLSPLEPRSSIEPWRSATPPFPPPSSRTFMNTVSRMDPSARPAGEPGNSTACLGIPPPFALQPQPQWDPQTFTPFTRPEFASWSYPSGSARSNFFAISAHERITQDPSLRDRHFYPGPSSGEPRRSGLPDPPLPHHIIPPSRGERHSTSASSSRASTSGHGHARSDDRAGEA